MQQNYFQNTNLQNHVYSNYWFNPYMYLNQYWSTSLQSEKVIPKIQYSGPEISLESHNLVNPEPITQKTLKIENQKEEIQELPQNQNLVKKTQYLGRNDFSNMFRSFLYLVFKCQNTKSKIKSLIIRKKLPFTLNIFSNKLKRKFPETRTYIGPNEIRYFFTKLDMNQFAGQKGMCQLLKILLSDFLEKEYKLYVIKKYKGKIQSKKQIFTKCRVLHQQLFSQQGHSQ